MKHAFAVVTIVMTSMGCSTTRPSPPDLSPEGDQARRRQILETVERSLNDAYAAFDNTKYGDCVKYCEDILKIDAHYVVALELQEDAQRARHRAEYRPFIKVKIDNWRRLGAIPYEDQFRIPTADEW